MSDITQFTDILTLLDSANKTLDSKVFVPSLNNDVTVKTLNTNHTKNIIKTTVEGPFADNQFSLIMYNILQDVLTGSCDIATLSIYDKIFILLQLRAKNIGDECSVSLMSDTGEMTTKKISINKHIDKLKKNLAVVADSVLDVYNDEDKTYSFTLGIPTMKENYDFENSLYQEKLSKIDASDAKQMKSLVAPMFLSHVAPFVKKISINGNDIDLSTRATSERIAVIERLSAKAILQIIKDVDNTYGKTLQEVTKVDKIVDGVSYTGNIKIDAAFFIG